MAPRYVLSGLKTTQHALLWARYGTYTLNGHQVTASSSWQLTSLQVTAASAGDRSNCGRKPTWLTTVSVQFLSGICADSAGSCCMLLCSWAPRALAAQVAQSSCPARATLLYKTRLLSSLPHDRE